MMMENEELSHTPLTYDEAMASPERGKWKKAMNEEIAELNKHTWKLVPLPTGSKPVKSKWVYATKIDANNKATRNRARLVAKGFTQRYGIEYDEIFAPVAKYSTVQFFSCLSLTTRFRYAPAVC